MGMLMTAEDCRSKATECEKRVGNAGHFEMKVQYRELAREWRYLAEQMEQLAARSGEQAFTTYPGKHRVERDPVQQDR
jgi:hypothetical protein